MNQELSKEQLDLLKVLKETWEIYPSMRFSQLLSNFTNQNKSTNIQGLVSDSFQYKDKNIIKDLNNPKFKKKVEFIDKKDLTIIPKNFYLKQKEEEGLKLIKSFDEAASKFELDAEKEFDNKNE